MTDNEILSYFYRGLIPGPEESEENFSLRVEKSPPVHKREWEDVAKKTLPSFQWAIDWMEISYSKKNLHFWEGGATWSGKTPFIQLNPRFQNKSYWGYTRIDLLFHEAVHAARIEFSEPQFEEVLAYSTASRKWSRFFGPIFTYTWELLAFFLCCMGCTFSYYIPLFAFTCSMGWLIWRHQKYNKCRKFLPLSIITCLTDKEIRNFCPNSFTKYLQQTKQTPRIRLIFQLLS